MEWMKLKVGKCLSPDPAGNQTCPCDFLGSLQDLSL